MKLPCKFDGKLIILFLSHIFPDSSSDNLKKFSQTIQNGMISDDTTTTTDSAAQSPITSATKNFVSSSSAINRKAEANETIESANATSASSTWVESVYDVHLWYDDTELVYVGIEKQDNKVNSSGASANETADKTSSVGSVSSLTESYALPTRCTTITSTNSTLSNSSLIATYKKTKHTIKGTVSLCDFMLDHFRKLRSNIVGDDEGSLSVESTPVTGRGGRGRAAAAAATAASTPTSAASKRKRGQAVNVDVDEEPKSAKKARKEPATPASTNETKKTVSTPATPSSNYPEKAVLARWIDKKFYAGRVIEQKPNNKFVVLFEDGAKKVLPEDHIVFGEENILPLVNECVHALVKDDTYEPGIVQSTESKDDAVYYTVQCESTVVTVTASDIYLEEDQAKVILSKHATSASNQPEPGFSGGVNTRKDRRHKRYS